MYVFNFAHFPSKLAIRLLRFMRMEPPTSKPRPRVAATPNPSKLIRAQTALYSSSSSSSSPSSFSKPTPPPPPHPARASFEAVSPPLPPVAPGCPPRPPQYPGGALTPLAAERVETLSEAKAREEYGALCRVLIYHDWVYYNGDGTEVPRDGG